MNNVLKYESNGYTILHFEMFGLIFKHFRGCFDVPLEKIFLNTKNLNFFTINRSAYFTVI